MEYLTKTDFVDWKGHPTTKKVQVLIMDLVVRESMKLAQNCGKDPMYDRYRSGVLAGIQMAYDFDTLFEGYSDEGDKKDEVEMSGVQGTSET